MIHEAHPVVGQQEGPEVPQPALEPVMPLHQVLLWKCQAQQVMAFHQLLMPQVRMYWPWQGAKLWRHCLQFHWSSHLHLAWVRGSLSLCQVPGQVVPQA